MARGLELRREKERATLRLAPGESPVRGLARVRREWSKHKKLGYDLRGNVDLGSGTEAPIALTASERRLLARVPASVFDRRELAAMLASPEDYSGGVAFVRGSRGVRGDLDASRYAALVVFGDLEVKGVLTQLAEEPVVIVTGDLRARDLIVTGGFFVGGDLDVRGTAYFEGNHGDAHVGGDVRAKSVVLDALALRVGGAITAPVLAREPELLHPRGLRKAAVRPWPVADGADAFPHFREVELRMLLGLPIR